MTYPPLFPQQPPPKRSRGPLLLVGGLVLLLIAIVVTGVVLVAKRSDDKPAVAPAVRTKPSDPTAVEFRRVLTAKPGACPTPTPAGTACDDAGMRYTLGKVELDGSNVSEVKAAADPNGTGGWLIALTLDSKGAKLFEQLTANLAKQTTPANQVAIVVRGKVAAAPAVQSEITGGKVQINGDYNRDSAEALATKITG
ncbi:SecDF P1 head subdomain-containing protein [Kribbella kalugense]|uniref:SecDF P1 head subdomain domain-containing protein n=1 Tax=Kribbella kalugense TaxID=2512221 RepID=A0A4R7ZEM9_9ACTN|nr:hypothetical protein [Kribbella kalugense]TDW15525.1 hypothetical protein EV650_7012 [Kribbella kalugense]